MWPGYSAIFLCSVIKLIYCDWESDWMTPLQERLHTDSGKSPFIDEEDVKMLAPLSMDSKEWNVPTKSDQFNKQSSPISLSQLKVSLKNALDAATIFQENVKEKIVATESRERMFKEVIANGRLGVTSAVVRSVAGSSVRSYIIKNGAWSLCEGSIQAMTGGSTDGRPSPTCIGDEIPGSKDACVFNSIIKYEVVPEHRGQEYEEEQILCLKSNFNNTFEQYWSVPKRIVADTCKKGQVRSMAENLSNCGERMMAEYTYYPSKSSESLLPLEYCTEKDGTCKLVVAWSLTNKSIENYEILKSDVNFQKHFIDTSRMPVQ